MACFSSSTATTASMATARCRHRVGLPHHADAGAHVRQEPVREVAQATSSIGRKKTGGGRAWRRTATGPLPRRSSLKRLRRPLAAVTADVSGADLHEPGGKQPPSCSVRSPRASVKSAEVRPQRKTPRPPSIFSTEFEQHVAKSLKRQRKRVAILNACSESPPDDRQRPRSVRRAVLSAQAGLCAR